MTVLPFVPASESLPHLTDEHSYAQEGGGRGGEGGGREGGAFREAVLLVKCMYLVLTRMPCELPLVIPVIVVVFL